MSNYIEHDARTALAASVIVQADHWYHHRHDLESEMVFLTADGVVKLDRRVPGDGTQWYVADWGKGWSCYDSTIEPGDLLSTPIENTPQAIEAAWAEYQQQSAQGAAAARAEPQGQLSNCAEQVDPLDSRIKRLAYVQEWSDALVQKALDCIGRELSADDVYGILKKAADDINLAELRGGYEPLKLEGVAVFGFTTTQDFDSFNAANSVADNQNYPSPGM